MHNKIYIYIKIYINKSLELNKDNKKDKLRLVFFLKHSYFKQRMK